MNLTHRTSRFATGLAVFGMLAGAVPTAFAQEAFGVNKMSGFPGVPIAIPQGQYVKVASVRLPAGDYVANAGLSFVNDGPTDNYALAYCFLGLKDAGNAIANAQALDTMWGESAASQALTVAGHLPHGGSVEVICTNNGPSGSLTVQTANLNAISVTPLHLQ